MVALVVVLPAILFVGMSKNISFCQEAIANVALYDMKGSRRILYDLLAELPDNGIMIINFTSIYCPPCRKEIPQLISIAHESNRKAGIIFIYSEDRKKIESDVSRFNIQGQAYTDVLSNIKKKLNIERIPTTVIVDKHGRIIGTYVGYSDANIQAMKDIVARLKK